MSIANEAETRPQTRGSENIRIKLMKNN
jgi:hypothetical protein